MLDRKRARRNRKRVSPNLSEKLISAAFGVNRMMQKAVQTIWAFVRLFCALIGQVGFMLTGIAKIHLCIRGKHGGMSSVNDKLHRAVVASYDFLMNGGAFKPVLKCFRHNKIIYAPSCVFLTCFKAV